MAGQTLGKTVTVARYLDPSQLFQVVTVLSLIIGTFEFYHDIRNNSGIDNHHNWVTIGAIALPVIAEYLRDCSW